MAALSAAAAAAIVAGTGLVSGGVSAIGASANARKSRRQANRAQDRIKTLEKNRQAVINPYENIENLSGMAKDLSSMANNPYSNLSVATGAAEIQAEEADIALANTLDTLRSTGSSAGGATALAQAALQSKKGISANIQQQEVNNEKLKAQGEATLQGIKMSEAQRMQMVNMSEAQRMQSAGAQGKAYMFEAREQRDATALARAAGQQQNAQRQQMQSRSDAFGAVSGGIATAGRVLGQSGLLTDG
tara:strand:- start:4418 stop:5155 length:738 start_codon:yes stop_codon:yes gene_type:complete